MKATFEQRIEALELVCFGSTLNAGQVLPMDAAGVKKVDSIMAAVCGHELAQLPIAAMRIKVRTKKVAWLRQIAMYLAVEHSGLSQHQIATLFNRKDHGTISYAHAQIADELNNSLRLRSFVRSITRKL